MQGRTRCAGHALRSAPRGTTQNEEGRSKAMGIIGLLVVLILIVLLLRLL
jgi:hypothetical protein